MRLDGRYDVTNATHNGWKIDRSGWRIDAKARGVGDLVRDVGALDQRLGRNASGVEAITAHLVRFNQRHLGLHHRRDIGRHQTSRACADDDQIAVEAFGLFMPRRRFT